MNSSYVVAARRSAIVPRNGNFAGLEIEQLSTPVIEALLQDVQIEPDRIGEVIVSNGLGAGGNPARLVTLAAHLPQTLAGLSLDRQCVGGLDALLIADAMIRSGQHDVVLAGGVESYSRQPFRYRTFADGSTPQLFEQARFTPWADRDPNMSEAADHLAEKLQISKQEQDDWAIDSHKKALAAQSMLQQSDIVPVARCITDPFTRDLSPALCRRAPVIAGSITNANMSVAADGAAFVMMVSEKIVQRLDGPKLRLIGGATMGDDPELPGLAPVEAIKATFAQTSLSPDDLNTVEIMEAFAVQAIACQRGANINPDLVNQSGGSLARGHPIGASGAVLAVRLFHHLKETGGIGLAAIAAAGGLGTALVVEASN